MMPYWQSIQGIQTADNRDFYGTVEVCDIRLFVLVDGATTSPNSGDMAKTLVQHLLEDIAASGVPPSSERLIDILARIHTKLRRRYSADSTSYIIAYQNNRHSVTTLHAGDCRLGKITTEGSIQWLTKPHTLANSIRDIAENDLKNDQKRHILTRSFKGRRFQTPESNTFDLSNEDSQLLLASDGFWAGLTQQVQLDMLNSLPIDPKLFIDDTSCLQWFL